MALRCLGMREVRERRGVMRQGGASTPAKDKAPCDGDLCDASGHGHGHKDGEGAPGAGERPWRARGRRWGRAGGRDGGRTRTQGPQGWARQGQWQGEGQVQGRLGWCLKEATAEQVKVREGWEKWHADIVHDRGALSEKEAQDYQGYPAGRANLRFPDAPQPLAQEATAGAGAGGVQAQRRRLLQVEESEVESGGGIGSGEEGGVGVGRRLLQASGEEGHEAGDGNEQHEGAEATAAEGRSWTRMRRTRGRCSTTRRRRPRWRGRGRRGGHWGGGARSGGSGAPVGGGRGTGTPRGTRGRGRRASRGARGRRRRKSWTQSCTTRSCTRLEDDHDWGRGHGEGEGGAHGGGGRGGGGGGGGGAWEGATTTLGFHR